MNSTFGGSPHAASDPSELATVEQSIGQLRAGKPLILVDDEHRENEGDLIVAAQHITPELIVQMNRLASGIITVPLPAARLSRLNIELMVQKNLESMGTAFTVTVDASHGVTTGSSAFDRAHTIRLLADPDSTADDFVRPGHVNPLRVRQGGVLRRAGHTEASHDLMCLAGLQPVAAICEIMDDSGEMMRLPELRQLARRLQVPLATIADLIRHRLRTETLITRAGAEQVDTPYGAFAVHHYCSTVDQTSFFAFVMGRADPERDTLVRMHGGRLSSDLLGALTRDSDSPLHVALERIAQEGRGVLVYVVRPVTPNGLGRPMDQRDYGGGAQVLRDLGVRRLRLLSDRPTRRPALEGFDLEVVGYQPLLDRSSEQPNAAGDQAEQQREGEPGATGQERSGSVVALRAKD